MASSEETWENNCKLAIDKPGRDTTLWSSR
jgi:hypothetical protein